MIKTSRRIAEFWCRMMHPAPLWPSHGHYRCRTCWRKYPVPWQRDLAASPAPNQSVGSLATASSPIRDAIGQAVQPAHPW